MAWDFCQARHVLRPLCMGVATLRPAQSVGINASHASRLGCNHQKSPTTCLIGLCWNIKA
jgi:hypothetical protein